MNAETYFKLRKQFMNMYMEEEITSEEFKGYMEKTREFKPFNYVKDE